MSKDNSIALIVVGLIGFLAVIITGKWLLDNNDCEHNHNRHHMEQRACPPQGRPHRFVEQQPQVIVQPPATQIVGRPYPQTYPQYHNRQEFWMGYSDGWNNFPRRLNCPEYTQGYVVGQHDRRCNRPYYHQQHCPPGFSLRVPGFSLNIR